ncbi:YueI family protein [Lapidilactobacillus luobeiensis]|uniref:YueI family protein n=1 Tax=Lapidilactobacillus luobeiensis TaxID=2950371 RepID=UPI0021C39C0C|nr:YueI family protein [Lapidilactobacillus luobeiensis]
MSESQDVNQRLSDAIYGTPQTLPDQRRQYMGSLRERVLLEIKASDLSDERTLKLFQTHLADFADEDTSALVNGKLDHQLVGPYLKELAIANFPFTLVNKPETPADEKSEAVLLVTRSAVNRETVDILALYPLKPFTPTPKPAKPTKKSGFFKRLF